jgi:DNA ligase (NAD+)
MKSDVLKGIDQVVAYVQEFETSRDALPYEIDGMVIKVNDLALQEKLGMTSHHPRWAIAFKFKARQATSKLLEVEYQVAEQAL